ncbi:MAG TPA: 50S ribosome-binding GTPase [Phycisphaerae bacterium]|nr:50S ribosome-binding GTPase [Phycisphaerae bacterium]HRW53030.1 50S ribosome-binding GTPase [Phycisphaerae bacterium]
MTIDDTIVAVSSPPGAGARGIVRLSGPAAISIANAIFHPADGEILMEPIAPSRAGGALSIAGVSSDGAVQVFPRGRSYTGQTLIEIHTLGAPIILGELLEACLAHGARRAEAGEFTARAYLSGRIDLTQAHGVAGMIAAQTDRQLQAAERLLHGRLGAVAREAREDLADLLSLIEGAMDFADEPIEFIDVQTFRRRLADIRRRLEDTISAGLRAERWEATPRVVLVGRPNAGKSSLLNRLSGTDRAISAPVAGTTRDAISAVVDLGESRCLMIDAAGAPAVKEEAPEDGESIDDQAARMASDAERAANLRLIMFDMSREESIDDAVDRWMVRAGPRIVVANHADVATRERRRAFDAWLAGRPGLTGLVVSARTGDGCEALREAVADHLGVADAAENDAAIALMAEHRDALERALDAMDRAIALADACDAQLNDADLAAAELRIAAEALGALVGMDHTEEMLGRIFSRFCVGK